MQFDEFVGQVQSRAKLPSRGDAETAIRATLSTLATRLDPGLAGNLAAQLPQEIGRHLVENAPFDTSGVDKMSLDEFFQTVAFTESEGVETPQAVFHARCVLEVVSECVGPGLMTKVEQSLPGEFHRLFTAGSTGRMARSD